MGKKPRPYIHWRMTKVNDILGALFVGRRVIPVGVLLALFVLGGGALAVLVSALTGMWSVVGTYFICLLLLSLAVVVLGALVSLTMYCVSITRKANSEEAWRGY